jgi:hypothetical protein
MEYLLFWLLLGFVAGIIGSRKGIGCSSFVWGFLLGPFGILLAIFRTGDSRECPYCRETVRPMAVVCRHCGKSFSLNKPASPGALPRGKRIVIRKRSNSHSATGSPPPS